MGQGIAMDYSSSYTGWGASSEREMGAVNQSSTSQLLPVFMLQSLLISSCFASLSSSALSPPRTLTITVFPSSTAEKAGREKGGERKKMGERNK